MATAFTPVAGNIRVIDGMLSPKKFPLPTTQRLIPKGCPLYNNTTSGVDTFMVAANGDATSVDHANAALVTAGFVGIALEARQPQQLATLGGFSAPGNAAAVIEDASRPWITVADECVCEGPCAALAAQHEIGEYVQFAGFHNEASVGFYDAAGALTKDTNYYLYQNQVQIAVTQATTNAIGVLCERAIAGQTFLRFKLLRISA